MTKESRQEIWFALLVCLTLGLAPFSPEPHIWGKLQWIAGGGNGMLLMDWFDTILHGTPWIYLFYVVIKNLTKYLNTNKQEI